MSQDPIEVDGNSVKEELSQRKEECVLISSDESGDEYALIEEVGVKRESRDSNTSEECASTKVMEWNNLYDDEVVFVKEEIGVLNRTGHADTIVNQNTNQLQHAEDADKTSVPQSEINSTNMNKNVAIMQESCKVVAAYLLSKSLNRSRDTYVHKEHRLSRDEFNFFTELYIDEKKFVDYFKMSVKTFEEIHTRLEPHLKRCVLHKVDVCTKERLAITIRYLTTGASMSELRSKYKLGVATIKVIIEQVCVKIWEVLKEEYLPEPNHNWQNTAQGFEKNANFPNCIGAMGVKCTQIACPVEESEGNKFEAMIILAMCDTRYRFTYVDVACGGKAFESCASNMLSHIKMPTAKTLPDTSKAVPYVIVADDTCAVSVTILRPYFIQASDILQVNKRKSKNTKNKCGSSAPPPKSSKTVPTSNHKLALFRKKIFNYRINRALRYIESTLAIMTNKFSIFERSITMSQSFAEVIVKAIFVLHNFVVEIEGYKDEETMIQNGLTDYKDNKDLRVGNTLRDHYANYFVSEGAVPWQNYIYL